MSLVFEFLLDLFFLFNFPITFEIHCVCLCVCCICKRINYQNSEYKVSLQISYPKINHNCQACVMSTISNCSSLDAPITILSSLHWLQEIEREREERERNQHKLSHALHWELTKRGKKKINFEQTRTPCKQKRFILYPQSKSHRRKNKIIRKQDFRDSNLLSNFWCSKWCLTNNIMLRHNTKFEMLFNWYFIS